jgi:peptide chain release factor 2
LGREQARLEDLLRKIDEPRAGVEDCLALLELAMANHEFEILPDLQQVRLRLAEQLLTFEKEQQFSEPEDPRDAYLDIQAGAGGLEAESWAAALLRMYLRWAADAHLHTEIVSYFPNDTGGLKSASILVQGNHAYGWLRTESGVHRLTRQSPFDAANKMQTSFASVFVSPAIDESFSLELNAADIEAQTYKASGPGGQYVNKTESAIRLRHIPSGLVVACQSERSQHQNRALAMKMLKARLYELEMQRRRANAQALESSKPDASWGHQIRSYAVSQSRVKDARTGVESRNIQAVLDGNITEFLQAALWQGKSKKR